MALPRFSLAYVRAALRHRDDVALVRRRSRVEWWRPRSFARELAALRAGGPAEAAVLAALGPEPEQWLDLPLHLSMQWEADLERFHPGPVGRLGGLCMRSLLDAWSLRDDPDWRPPHRPTLGGQTFLLDIDDYHGNGDFTVAVIDRGRLGLHYCDGHEFHRLDVAPLTFVRVGLQSLGWPSWPRLFTVSHPDPSAYQREYLEPMHAALTRWLPDDPRPDLQAATAAWQSRHRL